MSNLTQEDLKKLVRTKAVKYLNQTGINSVGVGYKIKDGKQTDTLCIQFTLDNKMSLESLENADITPLPTSMMTDDGQVVLTDVVERKFVLTHNTVSDPNAKFENTTLPSTTRRSRVNKLQPGISVGNIKISAGTLGAIVYDQATNKPLILSNWHVLSGSEGQIGDDILQPGKYDSSDIHNNKIGRLIRSHLGLSGDCAVASIEARNFDPTILELNVRPRRTAEPELNDKVVKSGRTTGVTYGIVSRVGVVTALNYGGNIGVRQIGCFEIGVNPNKPASREEISMGGDSGSLWLIDSPQPDNDIVVGLHFAGEDSSLPNAEYALACSIIQVFKKLNISLLPTTDEISTEELVNHLLSKVEQLSQRLQLLEVTKTECSCQTNQPSNFVSHLHNKGNPVERKAQLENGLPVHGNWCGPGHGGGPVRDELDGLCKNHDECYSEHGYFDCGCDNGLIDGITNLVLSGRLDAGTAAKAMAVKYWFSQQPCQSVGRVRTDPVRVITDGLGGTWRRIRGWF